jgi:hypothetical protein
VDFWTPFADSEDGLPTKYSSDGVHPNQDCYTLMENIILPVIQYVVSGTDVPGDNTGSENGGSQGGNDSDVSTDGSTTDRFTYDSYVGIL